MKYKILQKVKNAMFVLVILATLFLLVYYAEPVPETKYIVAADGEYLPVYYIKANATRHGNVVDIDYEDNIYSCYVLGRRASSRRSPATSSRSSRSR